MSTTITETYAAEIAGDYTTARAKFKELNDAITNFDGANTDHVQARLYHADMLTMDGKFLEAVKLLERAELAVEDHEQWAELSRHRGHAHRFGLSFKSALAAYRTALDLTEEETEKARLQTNEAEVLCWTDPTAGAVAARHAIQWNARLGDRIEVAKALAALAIAQSASGDFDGARVSIVLAIGDADAAGYPAGRLFAEQARVVTEVRAGDLDEAREAYRSLMAGIRELGTYRHLAVVPAWLLGDDVGVRLGLASVDFREAVSYRLTHLGSR